jgi:hypothetical protein
MGMTVRQMASMGAKAKFANMSPEERKEFARKAAIARWAKTSPEERSAFGKKISAGKKTARKSKAKREPKR